MQSAVLARLGIDVFNVSPQHYFDHRIGQETDHLSSLLKRVVSNTLSKVQKILRNATRSENTFQSFNIEVYEKFFFQLSF